MWNLFASRQLRNLLPRGYLTRLDSRAAGHRPVPKESVAAALTAPLGSILAGALVVGLSQNSWVQGDWAETARTQPLALQTDTSQGRPAWTMAEVSDRNSGADIRFASRGDNSAHGTRTSVETTRRKPASVNVDLFATSADYFETPAQFASFEVPSLTASDPAT